MQSPIIDVIVPFYNVDKYLARCIESILAQRYTDFSLLLVDDGSTDGSAAIAESFALRDARVHLFRQANSGQGGARNAGLAQGSAPFVCFVDSDDYVEDTFLLRLHTALTTEEADIAICAYSVHTRVGLSYHSPLTHWLPPVMSREEALNHAIRDFAIKSFCWNKMFRRSLFEHPQLRFGSCYFEDVLITPQLFSRATRVVQLQERLYHYCKRSGSLMSTQPERRIDDAHAAISGVRAFLCRSRQFSEYRRALRFCAGHFAIAGGYVRFSLALQRKEGHALRKGLATFRSIYALASPASPGTTPEHPLP